MLDTCHRSNFIQICASVCLRLHMDVCIFTCIIIYCSELLVLGRLIFFFYHWLRFWFFLFGTCALGHFISKSLEWIASLVARRQLLGLFDTFHQVVVVELREPLVGRLAQLVEEVVAEFLILVFCLLVVCTKLHLTLLEGNVEVGNVEAEALQLLWILFKEVAQVERVLLEFPLQVLQLYVDH